MEIWQKTPVGELLLEIWSNGRGKGDSWGDTVIPKARIIL
jgi:hypothetical protein